MSRTTGGVKLLEPLPGTEGAKARLAAIMATLSGEKSIPEVCAELGIGEARFHALRKEFLAQAVDLLEQRTPGRKPTPVVPEGVSPEARIADLELENDDLRDELEAARLKLEVALIMPALAKERLAPEFAKKKRRPRR